MENKENLNTIESNNYAIRGVHFDYNDLLLDGTVLDEKITIDFEAIMGDWALCYVCC